MSKNLFEQFTNQYELSKTLRFELKPLPATREFLKMDELEKEKLFPKDREKAENYQSLKYYLDLLHRDFINKALSKFREEKERIDFENLYTNRKNEPANESDDVDENDGAEKKKDSLAKARSVIAKSFAENGFLFGKEVIDHLEKRFQQEGKNIFIIDGESKKLIIDKDAPHILFTNTENKEETIFQNFKGFTGYLRGFNENRKNFYKDDGKAKAGRVATRIIDQNLPRFFDNIDKFKLVMGKYSTIEPIFSDTSAWENYFKEKGLNIQTSIQSFAIDNYDWKKVFEYNYYNSCFLQEDINFYNHVVSKLNKDINEYRQKLKSDKKEAENNADSNKKKNEIPFFQELHKQILGEVKKKSDFIEVTQPTIRENITQFIQHSDKRRALSEEIIIKHFLDREDLSGIYISNKAINTISNKWFTSWDFFGGKILDKQNEGLPESKKKKKISDFVSITTLQEVLNTFDDANLKEIFKEDSQIEQGKTLVSFLNIWRNELKEIFTEYDSSKVALEKEINNIPIDKDGVVASKYQKQTIKRFADASLSLYQMTKYFALLKGIKEVQKDDKDGYFYKLMDLYLFGGEFDGKEYEKNHIYDYYNAFRNFLTKKEWSEEKIKLNFENGNLLGGWSKNEEKVKLGVIFRDDEKYYLGIINNKNKSIFEKQSIYSESGYEKMEMMSLKWKTLVGKGYKRDFGDKYSSHVFNFKIDQYKKYLQDNNIVIHDLDGWIKAEDEKKNKDNQFPDDRKVLNKIIKFITKSYPKIYIDNLRKLEDYPYTTAIKNVQNLIDKQYKDGYPILRNFLGKEFETRKEFEEYKDKYGKAVYSLNFNKKIERDVLNGMIEIKDGKEPFLHLFQIYNKDFQLDERLNDGKIRKIEGKEDIETKLFKMLFDDKNLKNKNGVVFTLNGGAEIFFRQSSLDKKPEERNFPRKIERKKRYTENKIFLHVPITLNFGKPKPKYFNANDLFNRTVLQNPEVSEKVKIIGIDRGEKHLAYYSVIDQKGNILEQGTFNRIYEKKKDGSPIERDEKRVVFDKNTKRYVLEKTGEKVNYTDYLVLLKCKEKNRLLEQKSWDAIESIKDLKKGYISHMIHQICELIFKYLEQDGVPPILVFEKLNFGFKQGRQKIVRQVYQNIELAQARKLNYLTQKNKSESEPGGIMKALQFTSEIKNFGTDVEPNCQVGIVFYVDPSYTSATCPSCGFRKRINKTTYESVKKAVEKFEEHDVKIYFESGKYKFTFRSYQVNKDTEEKKSISNIVYSDVERIYRKKKEGGRGWATDIFKDLTQKIDALLMGKNIDKSREIFSQIKHISDKDFWGKTMWYFHLILQIRNSASKRYVLNKKLNELEAEDFDDDFINCPHCHFHSERQETWGLFGDRFPETVRKEISGRGEALFSGDANGAYNIARKGIMMIKKARSHPEEIQHFLKRNNMSEEELKKKLEKKHKYEIIQRKGENKEVLDSISKYPNFFAANKDISNWDLAAQNWEKFVKTES